MLIIVVVALNLLNLNIKFIYLIGNIYLKFSVYDISNEKLIILLLFILLIVASRGFKSDILFWLF